MVVGLKYVFNVTSIASAPKETDVPRLGFISLDAPAKLREVNFCQDHSTSAAFIIK